MYGTQTRFLVETRSIRKYMEVLIKSLNELNILFEIYFRTNKNVDQFVWNGFIFFDTWVF
jgi:hypothetical protein